MSLDTGTPSLLKLWCNSRLQQEPTFLAFSAGFLIIAIARIIESWCLYWGPNPQSQFRDSDKPKPFIFHRQRFSFNSSTTVESGGVYTMHRCMTLEHIQIAVPWQTQALGARIVAGYEELCRKLDLDRGLGASAVQQRYLLSFGGYRAQCLGVYRNVVWIWTWLIGQAR